MGLDNRRANVKDVPHHSISIHFIFIWVHAHFSGSSFCPRAMGQINGDVPQFPTVYEGELMRAAVRS